MIVWLVAVACGIALTLVQYGVRAARGNTAPVAALRAIIAVLLTALLLDARAGRSSRTSPDVLLDVSESWTRATDSSAWRTALDSARSSAGGSPVRAFGDSIRAFAQGAPRDRSSRLQELVDVQNASGRSAIVVTDGEVDDPGALASLPRGSRTIVVPHADRPDAAIRGAESPSAVLTGDTLRVRVTIAAGARGAEKSVIRLRLDGTVLDSASLAALEPNAERVADLQAVIGGKDRASLLSFVLHSERDGEPRNDSLFVGLDVTAAPSAVFVSSAPDFDSREAVAALRGVTSLPTRAYVRVAAGMWRSDAGLERVDEKTVRDAVHEAPMVILHGDTGIFGPPRVITRGSLLLFAPPADDDGEWFAFSAPASPLASAFAGIPFDSVPPLSVSKLLPRGEWQGLVGRRGGSPEDRRPVLAGWDAPRRIAVLGASGFWRWRFRGGVKADAFAAFFGSLFDWLAAGRVDRRAVVPVSGILREGQPIRWRRGAGADSATRLVVTRRTGPRTPDTLVVRFAEGTDVAETSPLPAGIYDVSAQGGTSVLAVNVSRELLPHPRVLESEKVGGQAAIGDAARLRENGWVYVLVVLLLCAEWLLRRRAGLR